MLPPDFNYSMIYDDIHKYLIPAGSSRRIALLAEAAVEELSAMNPDHMLVRSYLFVFIWKSYDSKIKNAKYAT